MVSLANYPDLGEKTYEVIRNQIIKGELRPGGRLLVVELAQSLGVSRTPVKDALNRLAAEGLLQRLKRKGFLVSLLDSRDVAELMDVRLMVELAAAERGIDMVEEGDLDRMRCLVGEMEQLIDDSGRYTDFAEYSARDCDLHLAAVGTARNRRLTEIYKQLNLHTYIVRVHYASRMESRLARTITEDHKTILRAFESRDLPLLRATIVKNIMRTLEPVDHS